MEHQENTALPPSTEQSNHSHHSSHHSSHHHHHKKKSKLSRFIQKNRKGLTIAAIILTFALVVFAALLAERYLIPAPQGPAVSDPTDGQLTYQSDQVYIGQPILTHSLSLLPPLASEYLASSPDVSITQLKEDPAYTGQRQDVGNPVVLRFDVLHMPSGLTVRKAQLELSQAPDFSSSRFLDASNDGTVQIHRLLPGTQYYYRLHITLSNGKAQMLGGSFSTAKSPRILTVDGIRNMRDIGGWETASGKTIQYGLLYRGTELDGAVEAEYTITPQGIQELVMELGIRTDMDLRSPSDHVSGGYILGQNVEHNYYGVSMYAGAFSDSGTAAMQKVFSDLADPSHYPIYMHCTYGQDRTGTVCYILEALLGVQEDDLIREYELSGLCHDISREAIAQVYAKLQDYPGATLQEKAESYLLSIGITQEQIASIRQIFLG